LAKLTISMRRSTETPSDCSRSTGNTLVLVLWKYF
jgi:hypothetical protein